VNTGDPMASTGRSVAFVRGGVIVSSPESFLLGWDAVGVVGGGSRGGGRGDKEMTDDWQATRRRNAGGMGRSGADAPTTGGIPRNPDERASSAASTWQLARNVDSSGGSVEFGHAHMPILPLAQPHLLGPATSKLDWPFRGWR